MNKIIVWSIVFLSIAEAVIWFIKRKCERKGWKIFLKCSVPLLVIVWFFYLIPVLISLFVFYPDIKTLNEIPGTVEQWFSFWPSYLGAAATVIIAIFTAYNSKSINDQEKRFLRLFTGNNLRVSKFIICKYKQEREIEETCSYRISIKFINLSYSMIKDIKVQGFYIRLDDRNDTGNEGQDGYREVENGVIASSYLLQGDIPYLTFDLIYRKDSEEGKKFTEFYYNDYYMKNNKLDVKIAIQPIVYDSKKKENMILKITLLMTSQHEEEWESPFYSSEKEFELPIRKVMTYCYSVLE